jgi:PAS domain S-box-containing protein
MEASQQMDGPLGDLVEIIRFTENVAAKIHGLLDESEIYRTVREEFEASERYTMSIALLTVDGSRLRIVETSMPPGPLRAAEEETGLRLGEYSIDLNNSSIYSEVVTEGITAQANHADTLRDLLPRPLAPLISRILGHQGKSSIVTPLRRHGKVTGAFSMSSPKLARYFIPSVRDLAQHISAALDLVDEYADRRRVEDALRESEQKYRTLVEHSLQGLVVLQDFRIVLANSAFASMSEYSVEELVALSPRQVRALIYPDDQALVWRRFRDRLAGEQVPTHYQYRGVRRDGEVRWLEMTATRIEYGGKPAVQGAVIDITERRRAEEQVAQRERDLRRLSAELISAQEAERRRISRELHDEMGQALTAMGINLAAIEEGLPSECSSVVRERLAEASWLAEHMLGQMRELSHELRPTVLDDLGLVPALRWYVDRYTQRLNTKVEFEAIGFRQRLVADVETALYRVVQEALTNVARHAQAGSVRIRLEHRESTVVALIEDDGQGFDFRKHARRAATQRGTGLIGMRERVTSLGGSFRIKSDPGQGTQLSVEIPVRPQNRHKAA